MINQREGVFTVVRDQIETIERFLGCETRERMMSFSDAKSGACEEDNKQRKIIIMRKQNPQHRLWIKFSK